MTFSVWRRCGASGTVAAVFRSVFGVSFDLKKNILKLNVFPCFSLVKAIFTSSFILFCEEVKNRLEKKELINILNSLNKIIKK